MPQKQFLNFNTPVVLVGGGDIAWPPYELLTARNYPVIAADGGANLLREKGIIPDAIIGDLDSASNLADFPSKTQIIKIAEQETTDFEKALYTINAPLFIAFGFWGKRLDHSLAAIHALTKYRGSKQVLLVDTVDLLFTPQGPFSFLTGSEARVSIFPLAATRFRASTGLHYPLDGLTVKTGTMIGVSNRSSADHISITPEPTDEANYTVILPNTAFGPLIEQLHETHSDMSV